MLGLLYVCKAISIVTSLSSYITKCGRYTMYICMYVVSSRTMSLYCVSIGYIIYYSHLTKVNTGDI